MFRFKALKSLFIFIRGRVCMCVCLHACWIFWPGVCVGMMQPHSYSKCCSSVCGATQPSCYLPTPATLQSLDFTPDLLAVTAGEGMFPAAFSCGQNFVRWPVRPFTELFIGSSRLLCFSFCCCSSFRPPPKLSSCFCTIHFFWCLK